MLFGTGVCPPTIERFFFLNGSSRHLMLYKNIHVLIYFDGQAICWDSSSGLELVMCLLSVINIYVAGNKHAFSLSLSLSHFIVAL